MLLVELRERIQIGALDTSRRGDGRVQVQHRRSPRLHFSAAELGRQPAVLPVRGAAAAVAVRVAEHDERRQRLVFRAQRVTDPGAQGWTAGEDLAGVDAAHGLRMVVVIADHRPDHAEVVGHGPQVGQQLGEVHTALAVLPKRVRAGHEEIRVAAWLEALHLVGVFLAIAFLQFRLRIEQVNLTGAAGLHEQDDGPGLSLEMPWPRPQVRPAWPRFSREQTVPVQQVCQRQRAEAEAQLLQEGTTRKRMQRVVHGSPHSAYRNSLVLRSV